MNYRNPILSGFYPDPSLCRVGENYYLVTSSFEYFPGVPIFRSRDLVHWEQIGHCLTRPSQLPLGGKRASEGIYAPTIRYHEGRFYMITTLIPEVRNFFIYTDDPAGEWSDPVLVDQPGIDPSLMFDNDGKVYCTSQGPGGLIQSQIDIRDGRRVTLWQPIWSGSGQISPEGPHLYHIGEKYYLFVAEGGTQYGHMETVARSDTPWGPFEPCPHNPILHHFNARGGGNPIQGTGHADLFQAVDGFWWVVFLGFRPVGGRYHHLGRETFLAPVEWVDGWPVVNRNGTVAPVMDVVGPAPAPLPPESTRDDFDEPQLRLCWNFIRNPNPDSWSLKARPGWLRLNATKIGLDDPTGAPAFVGRRQRHFQCRTATRLEFSPRDEGDEAGLTVLMNDRHHYEIALARRGDRRIVLLRRRIGDLQVVVNEAPVASGPIILKVVADEQQYRFLYGVQMDEMRELGRGSCRYLSSEVAGGWTGVYLGMYAVASTVNGTPADFDWFDYSEFYE